MPTTWPSATILIADDDPVTLQLLAGSLRREGYRVIPVVGTGASYDASLPEQILGLGARTFCPSR